MPATQCDLWFPAIEVPVGFGQSRTAKMLPVLTMVTGYSRWLSALLIPSRSSEDLFAGWWRLVCGLGAVPRLLVWDGEGAIGRYRRGGSELTAECQAFRGTLGTRVIVCKPADPEVKGLVERANGYLETSFLRGRTFTLPADFNVQLGEWLALVNQRRRRALGCAPSERIAADRAAMITLPPAAPLTAWRISARLPRDHYIRLDSNDYSVHPAVIGRRVGFSPIWPGCGCSATAGWSRTTNGPGPSTRRSATPTPRPRCCAGTGSDWSAQRPDRGRGQGADRLRRRARHRWRGRVMTTTKTASRDFASEIAFLTRALKAPTLRASVARLAERARAETWSHEKFLVACLEREVSARESHGGEGRIRAARFPARKSLEEFDFVLMLAR
jgi:transposase